MDAYTTRHVTNGLRYDEQLWTNSVQNTLGKSQPVPDKMIISRLVSDSTTSISCGFVVQQLSCTTNPQLIEVMESDT